MKASIQSFAVFLIAGVSAQTTVVNDPADTGIVTSYYSVCPTVTSTTITLPSTTTICPGGVCTSIITTAPTPVTIFGTDGKETIYNIETTILPALCDGGVCGATYTISEECPCTAGPKTVKINSCPAGFTTTVVECTVCAANGGPSTVTLTTPVATGPYASQTPVMGPATNAPAAITGSPTAKTKGDSGSKSGTGSGTNSGTGSGSSTDSGTGSSANTSSGSNSNVGTGSDTGSGTGSGTGSNAASPNAASGSSSNNSPAAANSPAGNSPVAPANRIWSSGTSGKNVTSPTSPAIMPYTGSADKVTTGASMALAGLVGAMAWFL